MSFILGHERHSSRPHSLHSEVISARHPLLYGFPSKCFTEAPKAICKSWIDCPRSDAEHFLGIRGDRDCDIAVLAVDATHAIKLVTRGAPYVRGGSLFGSLHIVFWINDRLTLCIDSSRLLQVFGRHMVVDVLLLLNVAGEHAAIVGTIQQSPKGDLPFRVFGTIVTGEYLLNPLEGFGIDEEGVRPVMVSPDHTKKPT